MDDTRVLQAYANRASEYTSILGSVEEMHELDRQRIAGWARHIGGRILDAGCGPGHWTDYLARQGSDVSGLDLVPEFIEGARARFPDISFQVGSLRALGEADGCLGGVLAWYSLIHVPPTEVPQVLSGFARSLAARGHLLIGFFSGDPAQPFDHAVTTAYFWSVEAMTRLLDDAGFNVVDVETRQDPGHRPHAAISAVLR
ncbi:class I SAM-dependent methyltransferase [Paeniglutamicibacter sp. R2-26]|uniref:class I SAM-dependent methyltransferase n=1 Tax=Paeniglutamicibacter sp. R2-26 TaxID=3144417 RepID=UPI003EE76B0C